jgi:hypothetical protein
MSTLNLKIQDLARAFVDEVMDAINGTSLQEFIGPGAARSSLRSRADASRASGAASARRGVESPAIKPVRSSSGRLPRRSVGEIRAQLDQILALLKKNKEGMRAEVIRTQLGLISKEMPRVLKEGLELKKLTSKGQKRATTYFAR